jgi:NAD-dependent DNA ligase
MDKLLGKIAKYNKEKLQQYFDTENIDTLIELKEYLDDLYYNTDESIFSDENYDMLKENIEKHNLKYQKIGARIREDQNRVELPFHMGSLNKLKSEDDINKWLAKNRTNEYIIEEKLDGISCLVIFKNNETKLYTRGDGVIGADISHLYRYFKNIPSLPEDMDLIIRGELIMKKAVFEKKYSQEYANPRNFVAGRIGGKKVREGLNDIEFIAYEVINQNPKYKNNSPSHQLHTLKIYGFKTPKYEILSNINFEILRKKLIEFKETSEYEIDGLVVQSDIEYSRNVSGNPSYSVAFKQNFEENMKETEVIEVEWNVSKHGVLKPRVKIQEVRLMGVKINYATGHNAKNIVENNIGPGAKILITRSNDVIPYIVKVLEAAEEPQMPNISYKWNETNVDIIVDNEDYNETMCIKLIASFFDKLGIKHVSEATVSKMYNYGLDSLLKIIIAKQSDFEKIEGFGQQLAKRTYENIHNGLQNIELYRVLGASSIFGQGIGEKKLKLLFDEYPLLLSDYQKIPKDTLYNMVNEIEGFSDITTTKIVENLSWADRFIQALSLFATFKTTEKLSASLEDKKFVFSGFRDKNLEKQIEERGGQVTTSVSSKTFAVIAANKEESSSKIDKATQLGLSVYEKDEFIEKYIKKV